MAVETTSLNGKSNKKCSIASCTGCSSCSSGSSSSSGSGSPGGGGGESLECPLCMEGLDLDDKSFYPCTCGYQICRFCWHRILSESSSESTGSCPACRKPYSENPANFKPLSVEDVQLKLKQQRKLKDSEKKRAKSTSSSMIEARRHLGELRVVQKNLVFVVGITPRIADPELLKKGEYFGRFGRIHKIVVNCVGSGNTGQSTTTPPPPSYGAYITYTKSEDALRAIQSVNNVPFDGKTIKASLGTTKYCSHFMRGQTCPKTDCMYLHSQGESEASFTKEDMQLGRHQEYERRLVEEWERVVQKEREQRVEKEKVAEVVKKVVVPVKEVEVEDREEQEEAEEPQPPPEEPKELPPTHDYYHYQELTTDPQHPPPPQNQGIDPLPHPNPQSNSPDLPDSNTDFFDPFYETQQAFESIIQGELMNSWGNPTATATGNRQGQQPPPGFFNSGSGAPWSQQNPQGQQDDWIDPAIIYSSNGSNGSGGGSRQQQNIGHLLGSSLLNDIFSCEGGGGGGGGGQRGGTEQQRHYPQSQQQQSSYPQNTYNPQPHPHPSLLDPYYPQKYPNTLNQPPPGFLQQQSTTTTQQQQQSQPFINNFFNSFPF